MVIRVLSLAVAALLIAAAVALRVGGSTACGELVSDLGTFVAAGHASRITCADRGIVDGWSVSNGTILSQTPQELVWQAPLAYGQYEVRARTRTGITSMVVLVFSQETGYDGGNRAWYEAYARRALDRSAVSDQDGADAVRALFEAVVRDVPNGETLEGPGATARKVFEVGNGSCDQQVNAFLSLATTLGMSSRFVFLKHVDGRNYHTVGEVFYDDEWHLFDPNHRVTYRRSDGRIAGHADLVKDPAIVKQVDDPWRSGAVGMEGFYVHPATFAYLISEAGFRNELGPVQELFDRSWARVTLRVDPTALSSAHTASFGVYVHEYKGNTQPLKVVVNGRAHAIAPEPRTQGEYRWRTLAVPVSDLRPGYNEVVLQSQQWLSWTAATFRVSLRNTASWSAAGSGEEWRPLIDSAPADIRPHFMIALQLNR